jgi:hypothetical protein
MSNELKDCPFCGGKKPHGPIRSGGSDERNGYNFTVSIACDVCGATISRGSHQGKGGWCDDTGQALSAVVADWNSRAATPPASGAEEMPTMLGDDYVHTIAKECGMYEQHDNAKPSAEIVIGFAHCLYEAIISNFAIHAQNKTVVDIGDAQVKAWADYAKLWSGGQDIGEMPPKFKDMFCAGWHSGLANSAPNKALVEALQKITAIEDKMVGGNWKEIDEARDIAVVALKAAGVEAV